MGAGNVSHHHATWALARNGISCECTGALNELAKLLPDEAELIDGKLSRKIAVSELKVGDKVLVRPGGQILLTGVVIKGESEVNESMLTGESNLESECTILA